MAGWRLAFVAVVCAVVAGVPGTVHAAPVAAAGDSTAADELSERAAALELLTFVPTSYRGTCLTFDASRSTYLTPYLDHITAALTCRPSSGADSAWLFKFDDAGAMNQALDAFYQGLPPSTTGDCPGTGDWDRDGAHAGRWSCYVGDDGRAGLNWTDDADLILSSAARNDKDLTTLSQWWETTDAAPLATPVDAGDTTPVSLAAWAANARELVATSVPRSERQSCRVDPITTGGLGALLYQARIWIATSVTCEAKGVDYVSYVQFRNDVSLDGIHPIDGVFEWVKDNVDEDEPRVESGTVSCESSGTWSRHGHDVGEYACFYVPTSHGGEAALVNWTEDNLDILSLAGREDGHAVPLLEFWKTPAAGPLEGHAA
ncbi:MAG TPA: hypothetical protein VEP49_02210 [Acidimicrobiia bacterium]|nr:hypothetical protein [Acidimicrobiia bacterium]